MANVFGNRAIRFKDHTRRNPTLIMAYYEQEISSICLDSKLIINFKKHVTGSIKGTLQQRWMATVAYSR